MSLQGLSSAERQACLCVASVCAAQGPGGVPSATCDTATGAAGAPAEHVRKCGLACLSLNTFDSIKMTNNLRGQQAAFRSV
jgi:hypothetical protein